MNEAFADQPQFLFSIMMGIVVFGSMTLTVLGMCGMITWRKHQAAKLESELKGEMIAGGMSADEIERVLAAKMSAR